MHKGQKQNNKPVEVQITLNQLHHQRNYEEDLQTHSQKRKNHLLKQMQRLSPNMTPRRTLACQQLIGQKTTMGHVTEQLFKRGWKWPETPEGKNAKLKRAELQQIVIDL